MSRLIPCCLVLLVSTAAATAEGLDPRAVPADVRWIIHVDVERLTGSTVGRQIIRHADCLDIDLGDLEEMEHEIGIDPLEDVFGLTLHGRGDPDEDLTVVAVTNGKIDAVIERAAAEESYTRLLVDGHTVHRWDDGEPTYVYVQGADRAERRIVVISGRKALVRDSILVLEHEAPSLEDAIEADDGRAAIGALPASGSLVFAYAAGLPWLDGHVDHPASAIVRRSNRLMLELRERNDRTSLDVSISARNRRDARNIRDVLRGAVALGDLVSEVDPELDELSRLLRAIDIDSGGNDVSISIEVDSRDLVEQLGGVTGHR